MFDDYENTEKYTDGELEMLRSAYNVISRMEMWEFLKRYEPEPDRGFMFDRNEEINKLEIEIAREYDNHTGSTMGITMRMMQKIAKQKCNELNIIDLELEN